MFLKSNMDIRHDYSAVGTPFRHIWEGVLNVDHFCRFVRSDVQEQLQLAHDEIGSRHIRAIGIIDAETRAFSIDPATWRDADRKRRANHRIVNYCIEKLLEAGVSPMITTCFTPLGLSSTPEPKLSTKWISDPPRDLKAWTDLVGDLARHLICNFGAEVVCGWYLETWNELNLSGFWEGGQQSYFDLWEATNHAIKNIDPAIRLDGPSTARGEWLDAMLEFSAKRNCPPDYLISHVYNNDSETGALSPFQGPQADRESKSPHFAAAVIRWARQLADRMGFTGEIHLNEWGRTWHPTDEIRETAAEAAWAAMAIDECSQHVDSLAYWCLSDIYDQVGYRREGFTRHYGMLSLDGLLKPIYHLHEFLRGLGIERLSVQTSDCPTLAGAIATRYCSPHGSVTSHAHGRSLCVLLVYRGTGPSAPSSNTRELNFPSRLVTCSYASPSLIMITITSSDFGVNSDFPPTQPHHNTSICLPKTSFDPPNLDGRSTATTW